MPEATVSFFRKLLDLREGAEEKKVIIENVKDDSDFSSARLWTLVFAIGVASVGLNINSIPVVIGAMLISPLMGPVVSIGLAMAINDWGLMRRSLRNLFILTVISIGISTLYFALTPITNAQSELLSRTQPTIFDVLIAIFGGIAGFIGVSRAKHSNIIPGVAIATALMPPLCTVGYGIGTLQPQFIFGAFYLFLINCIFICLSALLVAKYLKLPRVHYDDLKHQRRVRTVISIIIVVITTPALYLAFTFVQRNNFNLSADDFVKSVFEDRGYVVIHKNISYEASPHSIELAFLADHFSNEQLAEFNARLNDFGLTDTVLHIKQDGFTLTEEEWKSVLSEIQNDDEKVIALEARLENEKSSFSSPKRLLEEARAIDARVHDIALSTLEYGQDAENKDDTIVLIYIASSTDLFTEDDAALLRRWLPTRLEKENIITYFIPPAVQEEEATPAPEIDSPTQ